MSESLDPYEPEFGFPIAPWHWWFAWYPVKTLDHGTQWLRPTQRRRIHIYSHLGLNSRKTWWQHVVDTQEPSA